MQSISAMMSQEAVELLKQGVSAADVFDRLVARGAHRAEAQAFVQQLLDLKRIAEESQPARMLADTTSMLQQGASPAQVVQYFKSRGIADADIERLVATLRTCVPCQRCRALTPPDRSFFDRFGSQICGDCHESDEISAGDRRVEERRLQEQGVSAYALQKDNALVWCPRCQDHTGTLRNATHFVGGLAQHSSRDFVCTRCLAPL